MPHHTVITEYYWGTNFGTNLDIEISKPIVEEGKVKSLLIMSVISFLFSQTIMSETLKFNAENMRKCEEYLRGHMNWIEKESQIYAICTFQKKEICHPETGCPEWNGDLEQCISWQRVHFQKSAQGNAFLTLYQSLPECLRLRNLVVFNDCMKSEPHKNQGKDYIKHIETCAKKANTTKKSCLGEGEAQL